MDYFIQFVSKAISIENQLLLNNYILFKKNVLFNTG